MYVSTTGEPPACGRTRHIFLVKDVGEECWTCRCGAVAAGWVAVTVDGFTFVVGSSVVYDAPPIRRDRHASDVIRSLRRRVKNLRRAEAARSTRSTRRAFEARIRALNDDLKRERTARRLVDRALLDAVRDLAWVRERVEDVAKNAEQNGHATLDSTARTLRYVLAYPNVPGALRINDV